MEEDPAESSCTQPDTASTCLGTAPGVNNAAVPEKFATRKVTSENLRVEDLIQTQFAND